MSNIQNHNTDCFSLPTCRKWRKTFTKPRKHLIFWNGCVIIKAVDTVIGDCISRHPNIVSTKRAFCAEYPYYLVQSAFLCIERIKKYETN